MDYTCMKCGRQCAADVVPADGLCELCHASDGQNASVNEENSLMLDWKKPLYDYAVSAERDWNYSKVKELNEIYTRLGGYKDADKRLKTIQDMAQNKFEQAKNTIQKGRDSREIERAMQCLKDMEGFFDSAALIEEGKEQLAIICERKRLAQEKRDRAKERNKRRLRLLAVASVAAAVLALVVYYCVIIPGYVRDGDEALANNEFAQAIASYEKARARDRVRETHNTWGQALLANFDFEGAVEQFQMAGNREMREEVLTTWGMQLLAEGDYEGAVEKLEPLYNDTLYNAYRAWSDHLAETQSAKAAIEILNNVPESPEREARMAELQLQQADESLALLSEQSKDNDYARQLGEPITNLTAQLRYCFGLKDAGYDLMAVYPNGVYVNSVPLGKYQIEDIVEIDESEVQLDVSSFLPFERTEELFDDNREVKLDVSRFLLFERTEKLFDDYNDYRPLLTPRDRHDDTLFDVKLLPGQMFATMPDNVAQSWEEVSCIVLLDNVYVESGVITYVETKTRNGVTVNTSSTDYPYYAAVSCIAAYDKNNPKNGVLIDSEISEPTCDNDSWFNLYKASGMALLGMYRVGEFSNESMYESLSLIPLLKALQ